MRNITEHNITEAVIARFAGCDDSRLKEIMSSLVTHLHAFVRETRITEAEWAKGIEFLTATGHITDDKRQEFILLSDTLGVSMLTVAMNHTKPPAATEATVFGPFHVEGAPVFENGADISGGAPGEPLFVNCTVRGLDGEPIAGAIVDTWQADDDGFYDVQVAGLEQHRARGTLRTDEAGRFWFQSVLPVAYPIPTDGPVGAMLVATGRHPWRPAHVHFLIRAPGYETLTTHVFRAGDPYLDSDTVFGVRASLLAEFVPHAAEAGRGRHHTLDFGFVLAPQKG
ncbi:intradiol ring-cleavage dioxygenase [Paucibacter sp. R3-3]|uniref:Intradiol ring-cleavage dioxygenase n=1 Tax=Roseateles agri TaxID=3098619 RepID=A0ABU5DPZ4_9BURK|nr:intradiol ring-cleavage dioxygenase [Paucibacter sp. R3-3]MDY0747798.1 intradiol ring-cleavage dioxygenase [Paucibacter sp. R3-3]